jgi:hypothetical protein
MKNVMAEIKEDGADRVYGRASKPSIEEMAGTWKVKVIGKGKFLDVLGDKKKIEDGFGYNQVAKIKFGYFKITQLPKCLQLNYDEGQELNTYLFKGLRDTVRKINDDTMIGELLLPVPGSPDLVRHKLWFLLKRLTKKRG